MMSTHSPKEPAAEGQKAFRVRRGTVESVDLYEVKDTELEMLEKGSPGDTQLNFSIALLSTAVSTITTLATATFANKTVQTTFIVFSVVGTLGGLYTGIMWWRNRTSLKALCARIRERIPPEPKQAELPKAETPPLPIDEQRPRG